MAKLPFLPIFCEDCGNLRYWGHECEECCNPKSYPEPRGDIVRTEHPGYNNLISESSVNTAKRRK